MKSPQLTSLDHDGWSIDDGEAAHAENPDSFYIPPLAAREALTPGAIVKLRFYIRAPNEAGELVDHGERMWVQVKERVSGWYRGELDNDPYCTSAFGAGMELWFQPRHVIGIHGVA